MVDGVVSFPVTLTPSFLSVDFVVDGIVLTSVNGASAGTVDSGGSVVGGGGVVEGSGHPYISSNNIPLAFEVNDWLKSESNVYCGVRREIQIVLTQSVKKTTVT